MSDVSLCTVSIEPLNLYMELMIRSAIKRLKHVKEIIITCIDSRYHFEEHYEQDGVKIIKVGYKLLENHAQLINLYISKEVMGMRQVLNHIDVDKLVNSAVNKLLNFFGHALGLHQCIDLASKEYILFCDPDIIFLSNVDEIYLKTMENYSLQYIGCAHESDRVAYGYFPYVANSMVRKQDLPNYDFLCEELCYHGHLQDLPDATTEHECKISAGGKWLIRGMLSNHYNKFQHNTDVKEYDTASNLYIWALEKKWKWLSFLTADCHFYKTSNYRSNLPIKDKFKIQKLIYHQFGRFRNFENFDKIYQEYEEAEG